MEVSTKTKAGDAVRLLVDQDRHGVYQIYACFTDADGSTGQRCLCHGWGMRKSQEGMVEGILAEKRRIEVPREAWKEIAAVREDLRNRANLEDIHLVRVYFHGDRLTVDAYTLSAGIDRESWEKIKPCMVFVDSATNDTLYAGDRFVGWVIEEGKEAEVERLLKVKPARQIQKATDQ